MHMGHLYAVPYYMANSLWPVGFIVYNSSCLYMIQKGVALTATMKEFYCNVSMTDILSGFMYKDNYRLFHEDFSSFD